MDLSSLQYLQLLYLLFNLRYDAFPKHTLYIDKLLQISYSFLTPNLTIKERRPTSEKPTKQ